jgi:hypothetical protein
MNFRYWQQRGPCIRAALSRSSYFKGLAVAIVEGSYSVASLTRAMLIGSEWRFRFRYPLAVGHGGSGRVCSGVVGRTEPDVGGRGEDRIVARRLSLGARIRRQARRAASGAPPAGRWGLTARRGPSKGGHHAINAERGLASLTQLGRKFAGRATAIRVSAEAKVPEGIYQVKMIRMVDRRRLYRRLGVRQK